MQQKGYPQFSNVKTLKLTFFKGIMPKRVSGRWRECQERDGESKGEWDKNWDFHELHTWKL